MAAAAHALGVLLAAAALVWLVTHVAQRDWQAPEATRVTLGEAHYRIGPSELRWLEEFSTLHFSEGEDAAREIVAAEIDTALDRMFARAHEQLPAFADWYYSLSGEYSRLAMAALSYANLADADYVANRASSMLFPEAPWNEDLERLEQGAAARLQAHQERLRDGWLAEVSRRLSGQRVPAPLPESDAAEPLSLDALLHEIIADGQSGLGARLSLSTVAAAGAIAGPAVWRAAAARGSATAGRAVARVAGRGAARAGSAAASGALLCSPGGPAALACAVLAGAGVWVATDLALLSLDEHLNRDELVAGLEAGLDGFREQIEHDLLEAYDGVLAVHYDAVENDIREGFVPARAGRDAAKPEAAGPEAAKPEAAGPEAAATR